MLKNVLSESKSFPKRKGPSRKTFPSISSKAFPLKSKCSKLCNMENVPGCREEIPLSFNINASKDSSKPLQFSVVISVISFPAREKKKKRRLEI